MRVKTIEDRRIVIEMCQGDVLKIDREAVEGSPMGQWKVFEPRPVHEVILTSPKDIRWDTGGGDNARLSPDSA